MKMLITLTRGEGLIIDAASAGVVAQIMSQAIPCTSNGYGESERWSPTNEGLTIKFIGDEKCADLTALEKQLQKQYEDSNSARWREQSAHADTKKKLAELEAQIALLKSVTTCTVAEPETAPVDPSPASGEVVYTDDDSNVF